MVVASMAACEEVPAPVTLLASGAATVGHDDGAWLIMLKGEHDIATGPLLDRQARSVPPDCTLIVDLRRATFIDCSVVGWLLRTRRALVGGGGALRIVQGTPGGIVEHVFAILGLHDEFDCYPTRQQALAPSRQHIEHPSIWTQAHAFGSAVLGTVDTGRFETV